MKKKIEINQNIQNINNAKLLTNQVNREDIDLKITDEETRMRFVQDYNNSLNDLNAKIDLWISENVILSPIDGEIAFYDLFEIGHFLTVGQKLAAIIPHKKKEIIGKGYFPIENSGKVKIGCKVNLKFDAYSFKEYGIVEGVVSSISKIPNNGFYTYKLKLPSKLNTKYKNKIDFKQQTTASGEIITEDLTFLQRILHHFKDLYLNY